MQYLNQSGETWHASAPHSDIYSFLSFMKFGSRVTWLKLIICILNQFKGYNS